MLQRPNVRTFHTIVVGSGCAGLNCADSLYDLGVTDVAIVTEGIRMGTSINTGSDKQTYYKLSTSGCEMDSVYDMAKTYFDCGCMQGYHALTEAASSLRAFYKLITLGVDFPKNEFGEYVGYRTDHDARHRATSCGPLTSRFMAEKLLGSVKKKNIPVFEDRRVIQVLTKDGRACGVLTIDGAGKPELFLTQNVVLATGGPSGIYAASVYPPSQTGSLAIALEAGAEAVNLTEWQYGIASTDFRWNLSGTYMQVLPRFISRDAEGTVREFLPEYLGEDYLSLVFQKGYNWPFCPSKLSGNEQSSRIDLAVYAERQKGREVYLDYTCEPVGYAPDALSKEAEAYLKNSDVISVKTPAARLRAMNERAYRLFLSNGIDLETEPIRIDVCAQHCNGGIACDADYMATTVERLFVCGECAGVFGITRPGGSALNNTQVSSLRAAEKIASYKDTDILSEAQAMQIAAKKLAFLENLANGHLCCADILAQRAALGNKMSRSCAFVRHSESLTEVIDELTSHLRAFSDAEYSTEPALLKELMIDYDLLLSAYAVATAQDAYRKAGLQSRGSFILTDGEMPKLEEIVCEPDKSTVFCLRFDKETQTLSVNSSQVTPIPQSEQWFESVYNRYYRENHTEDRLIAADTAPKTTRPVR